MFVFRSFLLRLLLFFHFVLFSCYFFLYVYLFLHHLVFCRLATCRVWRNSIRSENYYYAIIFGQNCLCDPKNVTQFGRSIFKIISTCNECIALLTRNNNRYECELNVTHLIAELNYRIASLLFVSLCPHKNPMYESSSSSLCKCIVISNQLNH